MYYLQLLLVGKTCWVELVLTFTYIHSRDPQCHVTQLLSFYSTLCKLLLSALQWWSHRGFRLCWGSRRRITFPSLCSTCLLSSMCHWFWSLSGEDLTAQSFAQHDFTLLHRIGYKQVQGLSRASFAKVFYQPTHPFRCKFRFCSRQWSFCFNTTTELYLF